MSIYTPEEEAFLTKIGQIKTKPDAIAADTQKVEDK